MQILEPFRSRLARCETGPNQGQYRTITRGLLECTGEIMGWLNSDDMHFPWTLRAIGEIFRDFPEVEWVSSLHLAHWDYHGFCLGVYPNRGFSREAFLDGRYLPEEARMESIPPPAAREFIQQESMFWRRCLWERAGSYISGDFGSAGDFELCARFYRYAELVGVNIPLSGFRHQSGQQTRQMERYAELCVPPLKQYREEMHWQPNRVRLLAHESARLGEFGRLVGAALRPIGYSGKRIVRRDANTKDAHWELEPHRFL
jgi:hypothetical protein